MVAPSLQRRILIVNADDFGLNAAATDAILECHVAGSVTSTTLMANAPDCERAVDLAKAYPDFGIGLHFNLTWGVPVTPPGEVSSLVDREGRFLSRGQLARGILMGRINRVHLERELAAQWRRICVLGVRPSHVDSHQHAHGLPLVFDLVAAHCQQERIPMRVPWVHGSDGGGVGRRARRAILGALLHRGTHQWQGRVAWNDSINSIFDLPSATVSGELSDRDYALLLSSATGRHHELMVHAVTDASAMTGYTRIGEAASAEYRYLRQGGLRELAARHGFALGNYRDLA